MHSSMMRKYRSALLSEIEAASKLYERHKAKHVWAAMREAFIYALKTFDFYFKPENDNDEGGAT